MHPKGGRAEAVTTAYRRQGGDFTQEQRFANGGQEQLGRVTRHQEASQLGVSGRDHLQAHDAVAGRSSHVRVATAIICQIPVKVMGARELGLQQVVRVPRRQSILVRVLPLLPLLLLGLRVLLLVL